MEEGTYRIVELVEGEPAGLDTVIVVMPDLFYVVVDGQRTLLFKQFAKALRRLALASAERVGERLHSAEFRITTDPAVVTSWGAMHDCEECRAGVQTALRRLRDDPGQELIVGVLYWA